MAAPLCHHMAAATGCSRRGSVSNAKCKWCSGFEMATQPGGVGPDVVLEFGCVVEAFMVACNASGQIHTKATVTSVADMEKAQAALAGYVVEGHLRVFPSGEQGIIKSVGGLHKWPSPPTIYNIRFTPSAGKHVSWSCDVAVVYLGRSSKRGRTPNHRWQHGTCSPCN